MVKEIPCLSNITGIARFDWVDRPVLNKRIPNISVIISSDKIFKLFMFEYNS